jgi:acyl-CoA synthetase (AMP-forming)/AMP-acid ligase II
VLIYTSGTTGTPKGVMLSHENLMISAKTTAHFRAMDSRDKIYIVLPISHIVGISLLIMTLMVGGTARLVAKYDPAALAKAISDEGITILNGVPATYQRLLEYKTVARLARLDRGSLRIIAVAGAPLDLDLKSRVEKETWPAAFQWLRHHRMCAGHFRRALRRAAQRSVGGNPAARCRGASPHARRHTCRQRRDW